MANNEVALIPPQVEALRRVMIDAALAAYEDAGLRGLCSEGRWEAAVDAMRAIDLVQTSRSLTCNETD